MSATANKQPDPAKQVAAIQRRLERWELYRTQDEAEYWHSQCQSMVEQLRDDAREVGLTQDGPLVVMPTEAAQVAA